jgi:hypothetical protein
MPRAVQAEVARHLTHRGVNRERIFQAAVHARPALTESRAIRAGPALVVGRGFQNVKTRWTSPVSCTSSLWVAPCYFRPTGEGDLVEPAA